MHPGRVSSSVRMIVAAYTAYAVWMAFWVSCMTTNSTKGSRAV